MENTNATGNFYLISHLTLFTGLTDRTIRNYISSGILQGEKINGLWHFTPEQVDAFIRHPSVRPSILAKQNSIVYDFLLDTKKQTATACIILDLPGYNSKTVSEFFCCAITNGAYSNLRFSLDAVGSVPRIILTGDIHAIMDLLTRFYANP